MPIPETNELLLPLLKVIKEKNEYQVKEIINELSDLIELSEEDRNKRLQNNEPVISSRISSANTHLKKANLIESPKFGYYTITDKGLEALNKDSDTLYKELMKDPEFKKYKNIYQINEIDETDENINGHNAANINKNENNINTDTISKSPMNLFEASFRKELEDIQKEFKNEALKENKRKYYQPKTQDKSHKPVYEIKSNRNNINKSRENKENNYKKSDLQTQNDNYNAPINNTEINNNSENNHKNNIYYAFSPAEELLKFVNLLERGYISKEEFDIKKKELLNFEYKF